MTVNPLRDGKITLDTTGSRSVPYKKGVLIDLPAIQAQFMIDCGAAESVVLGKKAAPDFDPSTVEITEDGLKELKLKELQSVCVYLEFPEADYSSIQKKADVVDYILSDKEQ